MEVDGTRQELSSEAELVALCQEQYEQLGLVLTSHKKQTQLQNIITEHSQYKYHKSLD